MGLKNKVAIVSGGSRGIGKEAVISLAKQGVKVAFMYANNSEAADEVVDIVKETNENVKSFQVDIRNYNQVKQFVADVISEWKVIDILVNNAGIKKDKAMLFLSESDWNDVINTNLSGVFNLSKFVGYYMLKRKSGRIINISSISGVNGIAGQTNYSSSKAGIIGFTKSLAKEAAPYGVSVNVVTPGGVETDMVASMSDKDREKLLSEVPIGRLCRVEEVGKVILFLANDDASPDYMTGSVISLDGGMGL